MTIKTYDEAYRPQFHFSPAAHWMNDPNGMVYYEGEYHLFYQHHPKGTTWGPMHWGHAVSRDLVHWEHLPVALEPDEHGFIFSGSAVVDWNDSTGFFSGKPGLVAIFTHADTYPGSERPRQRQSIAYSLDKGRTWMKYEGNPVCADEAITDFRDPKVFWDRRHGQWVMVLASGDHVRFYVSKNLLQWTFSSAFGSSEGSHDGVWECPDLFELPVDGDPERTKWVLIVSIGDHPDLPEGSRTQYFIGDFDGRTFTNDAAPEAVLWLDHGRDNYAGVTWSDVAAEDGRRLFIGWMSNWKYANFTPTVSWRSAATLPRELTLREEPEGVRLTQQPAKELELLRLHSRRWRDVRVEPGANLLSGARGDQLEIEAEFELGDAEQFGIKLRASSREETVVAYDVRAESLFIDRTKSGATDFHKQFGCKHGAPMQPKDGRVKLRIFVDWSSVEVFAADGKLVMTDLVFPDPASRGLELYAVGGAVKLVGLELHTLKSIYENRDAIAASE
ncbi:glycoside hydrolase family 32 protein [Paenibacillus sp.]|uniref:glycoside hydrolase family 32 protein n=1 Tax=Paenibacillus sp. TaxID=58172 RepID=UPI002811D24F|nr:glycoside hydrolase family 32 protein [Paenibacillus sp.]